jgi:hypothetical protein
MEYSAKVINEYLLTVYFRKMPRQPQSLHLKTLATLEAFTACSKKFLARLLLIVPTFLHEGQFEVSGKHLKKIFSCNTVRFFLPN